MNTQPRVKYPRTSHLPWSLGRSSDDIVAADLSALVGKTVVVTEKMDGENTTLYSDGFHARSIDSRNHPSRNWLAAFHASIAWKIPQGMRICGENLYARHSVAYTDLPSYFMGFSVWVGQECLSWQDTLGVFAELGITSVPVLDCCEFNVVALQNLAANMNLDSQEGYVVRTSSSFDLDQFNRYVLKFVRKNHVTTDRHWQHQALVANGLGRTPGESQ